MARFLLSLTAMFMLLTPLACGNGGAGSTGGGGYGGGLGGDVSDCATIKSNACFTNGDCTSSADRCQVVGTQPDGAGGVQPVACCVAGARGTGKAGDPCTKETQCESGLCEEDMNANMVCSKTCTMDSDCPASIPSCVALTGTVGSGSFCAPPA